MKILLTFVNYILISYTIISCKEKYILLLLEYVEEYTTKRKTLQNNSSER